MFAKPASLVLLLAVFLQVASGSFALNTASSPQTGIGRRQSSFSSSTSSVSVFVQQWSVVRNEFSRCSNVFNSGASVEVAITSVKTLYQSCSTVANQYSTCNGCASAASSQAVTAFRSSIEVSFQTWQQILTIGQQRYASVWKSQFASVFQQFSTWVTAAKTACSSLNLQLDVILKGLNLNLNLFLGININLSGLLGGVLGAVGGILGGLTAFRSSIEVSFQTWQQILTVGQQRYASVWKSQFASVFQQFSTWVTAAKTACSSFNLQLDVILKGLNLNLNLFLGVNINLSGLLGGVLGLVGGVGGVGSLVGGLLGRRELELLE
ncbi:hypothetical protein PSHT_05103 [Puccinia striiformis]|uniref:Transmembrane protein n=1 Tax=Puccinia striiformis TaxID=27350 RepID=A0A2S4WBE6_9BASI|nr:hypothetical protein PSHT_05103 [Puccinia striiformis]